MADLDFVSATTKQYGTTVLNLIKGWAYFYSHEIVVGITEETAGRGGPINNAELAYLHTNGSAAAHIPARPFLEPALSQEEVFNDIQVLLKDAAEAALTDGDIKKCEEFWEKAGMKGRDACKDYVLGGVPPPNAPSTIAKKGSSMPLIDTGAMMEAITYAVRRK